MMFLELIHKYNNSQFIQGQKSFFTIMQKKRHKDLIIEKLV